jgi:capsular polysaccharide biosynthesis protein
LVTVILLWPYIAYYHGKNFSLANLSLRKFTARILDQPLIITKIPIHDINKPHSAIKMVVIEPTQKYTFHDPLVWNDPTSNKVLHEVEVPAKWLAKIRNIELIGAFQLIHKNKFILYEPASDPRLGFVAGSWKHIKLENNRVVVDFRYTKVQHLKQAILISGRCSPNYFHWLIEYLPKLYLVAKFPSLAKIPLIVHSKMVQQQIDSLKAVAGNWPLHWLDDTTLLKVDALYVPSVSTYHVDHMNSPFWQGGALCIKSLDFIKANIYKKFNITPGSQPLQHKIYLGRTGVRNITNHKDVEACLRSKNIEIIYPENLSFAEQVNLFANCSLIIGPLGAAFSNIIFCAPGTKIIGLANPVAKTYCMQANLAKYAQCEYQILAGYYQTKDEVYPHSIHMLHANFYIDIQDLENCIAQLNQDKNHTQNRISN